MGLYRGLCRGYIGVICVIYGDNGKENGNYRNFIGQISGMYRGSWKMETTIVTIVYWSYSSHGMAFCLPPFAACCLASCVQLSTCLFAPRFNPYISCCGL